MGEIAEMMLEGTLCECCGVVIIEPGEEAPGYPMYCSYRCAKDRGADRSQVIGHEAEDAS